MIDRRHHHHVELVSVDDLKISQRQHHQAGAGGDDDDDDDDDMTRVQRWWAVVSVPTVPAGPAAGGRAPPTFMHACAPQPDPRMSTTGFFLEAILMRPFSAAMRSMTSLQGQACGGRESKAGRGGDGGC